MKTEHELISFPRSTSYRNNRRILPSNSHHHHSRSSSSTIDQDFSNKGNNPGFLRRPESPLSSFSAVSFPRSATRRGSAAAAAGFSSLLRSLLTAVSTPAARWLGIPAGTITPSLGRKVTGTLFGHRRGHVTFAVQYDPRSEPALLLELATSTSALVKEMSSGLVRIALECERGHQQQQQAGAVARGRGRVARLFDEPMWTMYCNGRKCGYAVSRACGESDWHLLSTVQSVSVGAGVIPVEDGGDKGGGEAEVLYMRARFERVVGSRDSEAFYMMNPDGNGGPELGIFLLRV